MGQYVIVEKSKDRERAKRPHHYLLICPPLPNNTPCQYLSFKMIEPEHIELKSDSSYIYLDKVIFKYFAPVSSGYQAGCKYGINACKLQ